MAQAERQKAGFGLLAHVRMRFYEKDCGPGERVPNAEPAGKKEKQPSWIRVSNGDFGTVNALLTPSRGA